jgi:hypothetical protein
MNTKFIKHHIEQNRVDTFVKYTRRYLKRMNIRLEFRQGATVRTEDGESAEGFFYEPEGKDKGVIVIAKGRPRREWLTTLAHELGHVNQWLTEDVVWSKGGLPAERDAENHSQKLIKKFNLPVDARWHKIQSKKYISFLKKTPYTDNER